MAERSAHSPQTTTSIVLVSVLALFLEMMLVRWVGTEIRIFAYLQNTILVACILGLGVGCFTASKPVDLAQTAYPLGFLLGLMALPQTRALLASVTQSLSVFGDLVMWTAPGRLTPALAVGILAFGMATLYLVLVLVVDSFVPIGRLLGSLLERHPDPIRAYSANIAGSLVGTWLFVGLSALYEPPVVWSAACLVLVLPLVLRQGNARPAIVAFAVLLPLSWLAERVPEATRVVWSPYQKLALEPTPELCGQVITVNNIGYQAMCDLRPASVASVDAPGIAAFRGFSQYDLPLLFHPNPQRYLVVGAGSGNDVAGGLRHGASEIVAVEIDPGIIRLGREFHPEQPYSSPHVRVVNDDARSFLATTSDRFDVITFGLLDSHTTTAMTNARLDSYVYTRESLLQAKRILAPGGIICLSFEAQKPFIADRMAAVLREVFGEAPLAFRVSASPFGWGGVLFVAGDLAAAQSQMAANPDLAAFVDRMKREHPMSLPGTTRITTDDWPYTYLEAPRIPVLYYLLAALMGLVWFRTTRKWSAKSIVRQWGRSHWHFFLLGAAFLLLEVQNISKASVALGNTWQVNAVITSGVLVMALAANEVARRFPRLRTTILYVALVGTCVALYFVDLSSFAALSYATRVIVIGALTTCPMLFSGIIFARSFARGTHKDEAFGANLAGALVGALLQSLTFVIGIKALLLVVAGLYLCSYLVQPARPSAATAGRAA